MTWHLSVCPGTLRHVDSKERAGQVCAPCCGVHDSHLDCLMLITWKVRLMLSTESSVELVRLTGRKREDCWVLEPWVLVRGLLECAAVKSGQITRRLERRRTISSLIFQLIFYFWAYSRCLFGNKRTFFHPSQVKFICQNNIKSLCLAIVSHTVNSLPIRCYFTLMECFEQEGLYCILLHYKFYLMSSSTSFVRHFP